MSFLPWKRSPVWALESGDPAVLTLRRKMGELVSERSKWETEAKNHYYNKRVCQQRALDLTIQIERLTNVIAELEKTNGTSDR